MTVERYATVSQYQRQNPKLESQLTALLNYYELRIPPNKKNLHDKRTYALVLTCLFELGISPLLVKMVHSYFFELSPYQQKQADVFGNASISTLLLKLQKALEPLYNQNTLNNESVVLLLLFIINNESQAITELGRLAKILIEAPAQSINLSDAEKLVMNEFEQFLHTLKNSPSLSWERLPSYGLSMRRDMPAFALATHGMPPTYAESIHANPLLVQRLSQVSTNPALNRGSLSAPQMLEQLSSRLHAAGATIASSAPIARPPVNHHPG